MRIKVDSAKCDGFGTCAAHAPREFTLDEWGYAYVEGDGTVADGDEELVRRAIIDCPVHAISEL